MPEMIVLYGVGLASLAAWIAVVLLPGRPWDFQPVGDESEPPPPAIWPRVTILVPARNESASLPRTLPALLKQDYPGEFSVWVIDDRSVDGTAETARALGAKILIGRPLPEGWVGKVWALEQGLRLNLDSDFLWLTDADILHAPGSLRKLVAESEASGLALNSRMARLRCSSFAERLLIPPFVFFFGLLYPMRRVNQPDSTVAAAAGGCILLRRAALERAGGFDSIRGELIDDVRLARRIKALKLPIRLALSRSDVVSLREYGSLASIWRMVRRTAFVELRRSWLRLGAALAVLGLLFFVPPLWALGGLALTLFVDECPAVPLFGLLAWAILAGTFRPAVRFFGLSPAWAWTLPAAGLLYGAMTLDSALRCDRAKDWR